MYVSLCVSYACKCPSGPEEKVHLNCIRGPLLAIPGLPRSRLSFLLTLTSLSCHSTPGFCLLCFHCRQNQDFKLAAAFPGPSLLLGCLQQPWTGVLSGQHHTPAIGWESSLLCCLQQQWTGILSGQHPTLAVGWESSWVASAFRGNPFLEPAQPASLEGHTVGALLSRVWPCSPSTLTASNPCPNQQRSGQRGQQ